MVYQRNDHQEAVSICQLFGISASAPTRINSLIRDFITHADENSDGWGYADFSRRPFVVTHSPDRADTSPAAERLLAAPLEVTCALTHIRKATVGYVEIDNCHPFIGTDTTGRQWTLIHKGTVFDSDLLDPFFHEQQGGTDSERILLYLIEQIDARTAEKGAPLETAERFAVFETMAMQISPGNTVALIVHDSDQLYIHSNYNGALCSNRFQEGIVFCTSELADGATAAAPVFLRPHWEPVPLCQAFAFKQGRRCCIGSKHDGLYVPKDEDTRYFHLDYSSL